MSLILFLSLITLRVIIVPVRLFLKVLSNIKKRKRKEREYLSYGFTIETIAPTETTEQPQ